MQLTSIKNISEKRQKDFEKLGVFSVEDLINYYPRSYLDLTRHTSLKDAYHNDMVLFVCTVTAVLPVNHASRLKVVRALCNQDGFPFTAVWFNQPYVAQKLKAGEYLFYGRVQNKYDVLSITNPTFEPLEGNTRLKGIVPVYSVKGSLTQRIVSNAIKEALHKENILTRSFPIPCNKNTIFPPCPKPTITYISPPPCPSRRGRRSALPLKNISS
ncbi:MAG: hypothetical protein IKC91_01245 [Clostridia bacterium]|nr:hypothetical protein [Clostridia bacterium]